MEWWPKISSKIWTIAARVVILPADRNIIGELIIVNQLLREMTWWHAHRNWTSPIGCLNCLPKPTYRCFQTRGYPFKKSIYRWIFHFFHHPAIGLRNPVPPIYFRGVQYIWLSWTMRSHDLPGIRHFAEALRLIVGRPMGSDFRFHCGVHTGISY